MNLIEELFEDIRYALRVLRKSPAFTATAAIALALGIGANTAIFTVVNAVLLLPLAYPEPDRLVQLEFSTPHGNINITSIPRFNVWREQSEVFQDVAAYESRGLAINFTGSGLPEQLKSSRVSAKYFQVFGARMALGRAFSEEEDRPNGPKLVVISNGLWRRRFGSDPGLLGKSIELGGDAYVISGVLGPSFTSDPPADLYLPLQPNPSSNDQALYLRATARLKPGITLDLAKAQMKLAAAEFGRKFPNMLGPQEGFTVEPLQDSVVGDVRQSLLILFGAVIFVLFIACANVANLLLARSTVRRREMAIRVAVGATRGRIMRLLLTESVLLSLIGGSLGLILGYVGLRGLLLINPGNIPRIGEAGLGATMDWRVLTFALIVSALTGVLFGIIPALSVSQTDINPTLNESGSRSLGSLLHNKTRSILVVSEITLALVLLTGAALLLRTFSALRSIDTGFDAHNVLAMQMSLSGIRFEKTVGVNQLVQGAQQRVENLPGVLSFASTCCLPLEGGFALPFTIEGRPLTAGPYHGGASWRSVSPGYFEVFRIPLHRGRLFTNRDDGSAERVLIINEGFAKQYWPNGDAVGQRITIGKGIGPEFEEPPRQIIGIVGDTRDSLESNRDTIMYLPLSQVNDGITALSNRSTPITWVVRTRSAPYFLSTDVQRELVAASGGLPVAHVRSMDQVRKEATLRSDFNMMLLAIFAGTALLLAAIGIYGLMAYLMGLRTQEIGIRMILGADPWDIRKMMVVQGMRLSLIGLCLGVAAALALSRLMTSLLYGVKPWDPLAIVSVTALLGAVAFLATYVPALRASRVEPASSLRCE